MEEKYGEVEEMNVCDNLGDHLVGNVYVKVKCRNKYRYRLKRHTKWSMWFILNLNHAAFCWTPCRTIADETMIGQKKNIGCFCYFKSRTKSRKIAVFYRKLEKVSCTLSLFSSIEYPTTSFPMLSIPPLLNALGHQCSWEFFPHSSLLPWKYFCLILICVWNETIYFVSEPNPYFNLGTSHPKIAILCIFLIYMIDT